MIWNEEDARKDSIFSAHIGLFPVLNQTSGVLYLVMRSNVTNLTFFFFQNSDAESVDT